MPIHDENRRIRVLLCDDHPMMLLGIKDFLSTQKAVEIVQTAADGEEAVRKTRELKPDIVLMDIGLKGSLNGIEAAALIRKENRDIKVIFLTMHDEEEYVRQFIRSGANGYVLKESPPDELASAINSVFDGHAFFSPAVSSKILKNKLEPEGSLEEQLTHQEIEVLKHIAKGLTSKEIGDRMYISERTVGTHRGAVMGKLDLHTIAELTQYAILKKLI